MIDYKTQRSTVPDDLLASNILPPPPAVMAAMARNHYVVATSTSVDPPQVARSIAELESGRFAGLCPEIDRGFIGDTCSVIKNDMNWLNDIFVVAVALWLLLQGLKKGK